MKKQPLLIIIGIIVLGGIGLYFGNSQKAKPPIPVAATPSPAKEIQPLSQDLQVETASFGQTLGKKEAKVTMVEFSDFQCPYCQRFSQDTFPQIKKDYIDTGKIYYVFHNYPLLTHQYSQKASEATLCAGEQGKFWEMHDQIFTNQQKIAVSDLKNYAQTLELKTNDFNSCLDSGKEAGAVNKDKELGDKLGVSGTPTFFVNGRLVSGALPFSSFKVILDEELGKF
ncbi:MAG: DsbA family protein [bacterium]|nr:DsbA family protein [bacterium]